MSSDLARATNSECVGANGLTETHRNLGEIAAWMRFVSPLLIASNHVSRARIPSAELQPGGAPSVSALPSAIRMYQGFWATDRLAAELEHITTANTICAILPGMALTVT